MAAAEFAIRNRMQTGLFLKRHGVANGGIFDDFQGGCVDFAVFCFGARIAQSRGPKQTSHMISAEWGPCVFHHCRRPGISARARFTRSEEAVSSSRSVISLSAAAIAAS